jgi:hypothetical protein
MSGVQCLDLANDFMDVLSNKPVLPPGITLASVLFFLHMSF